MAINNNQLTVSGHDRGDVEEERQPGWVAWRGIVPLFGVTK